jgi:hypothetical protein
MRLVDIVAGYHDMPALPARPARYDLPARPGRHEAPALDPPARDADGSGQKTGHPS